MKCSQCGQEIADNTAFCTECGAKVEVTEKTDFSGEKPDENRANQQNQQSGYASPVYNDYEQPRDENLVGIGTYVGMMILAAIPVVGLIIMCIWGFSSDSNMSKKNFARALLIMMAVNFLISIVLLTALGAIFAVIYEELLYLI